MRLVWLGAWLGIVLSADAAARHGALARALAGGGPVDPGAPGASLPPADALPFLLVLSIVVFAIIGYLRGFGKEWLSALIVTVGYWLIDRHWGLIAALVNRCFAMFGFAAARLGVLADGSGSAESVNGGGAGLIGPGTPSLLWQIVFFTAVVLFAYVISSVVGRDPCRSPLHVFAPRNMVSRLMGAIAGGWSGFLIGWFYLERLLPGHVPGSGRLALVAHAVLGRIGPMMLLGAVVVLIVFGVLSLGGRRKRVYT